MTTNQIKETYRLLMIISTFSRSASKSLTSFLYTRTKHERPNTFWCKYSISALRIGKNHRKLNTGECAPIKHQNLSLIYYEMVFVCFFELLLILCAFHRSIPIPLIFQSPHIRPYPCNTPPTNQTKFKRKTKQKPKQNKRQ